MHIPPSIYVMFVLNEIYIYWMHLYMWNLKARIPLITTESAEKLMEKYLV